MTPRKIELGQEGEELAAAFLKNQGYKIQERNFKNNLGEIDIVAWDVDTLCFIEVKRRTSELYGTPLYAISKSKQHKLSQVALSYLKYHHLMNIKSRFDIVSIIRNDQGEECVDVLKDAFDLSSPYSY